MGLFHGGETARRPDSPSIMMSRMSSDVGPAMMSRLPCPDSTRSRTHSAPVLVLPNPRPARMSHSTHAQAGGSCCSLAHTPFQSNRRERAVSSGSVAIAWRTWLGLILRSKSRKRFGELSTGILDFDCSTVRATHLCSRGGVQSEQLGAPVLDTERGVDGPRVSSLHLPSQRIQHRVEPVELLVSNVRGRLRRLISKLSEPGLHELPRTLARDAESPTDGVVAQTITTEFEGHRGSVTGTDPTRRHLGRLAFRRFLLRHDWIVNLPVRQPNDHRKTNRRLPHRHAFIGSATSSSNTVWPSTFSSREILAPQRWSLSRSASALQATHRHAKPTSTSCSSTAIGRTVAAIESQCQAPQREVIPRGLGRPGAARRRGKEARR